MSGAAPGAMDISKVVKERKFNSGGQGSVWAVKDRTINGVWPVAYKEYHQATRGQLKADVLAQMVGFMSPSDEVASSASATTGPRGALEA